MRWMHDEELSPQQKSVLQCSWDGLDTKETAMALGLSEKTVKNYRAHIYQKFGVGSVEGMLRQGVERGHIVPSGLQFERARRLTEWPGSVVV